jgi:hypothetical protein
VYHPFSSPLRQGDISTLQKRGHFYFALTGKRSGDYPQVGEEIKALLERGKSK